MTGGVSIRQEGEVVVPRSQPTSIDLMLYFFGPYEIVHRAILMSAPFWALEVATFSDS